MKPLIFSNVKPKQGLRDNDFESNISQTYPFEIICSKLLEVVQFFVILFLEMYVSNADTYLGLSQTSMMMFSCENK